MTAHKSNESKQNFKKSLVDKKNGLRVTVRLTKNEYKEVCEASKNGISKSDVIRFALSYPLKHYRPAPKPVFTQKDYDLLDTMNDTRIQLARSGNLLNQLVRDANNGDNSSLIPDRYMKYINQLRDETDTVKSMIGKVEANHG